MNNPAHAHDPHAGETIDPDTAEQLTRFIERVERLTEEAKEINANKSDVFQEAKSKGFDPKIMKMIIKDRAKDPDALDKEEAIKHLYEQALGMHPAVVK